jgi:hypothetical protein
MVAMSRPAQQRSELAEVLLSFRQAFMTVGASASSPIC